MDEMQSLKVKITPKERSKLYREKKLRTNPNWDKERAKKWRTEHPEAYNYGQCKHFWKRLNPEQRTRLLNESVSV